ncbi:MULTISPECIES: ABC transporter ATP-binding protein [Methylocaldum]|jgi:putative ABC transport system ATP-binding protein|uniref:ABC transporter ATP-binding protein n=1 Tax=unclassified Methylocaldum TaxID=2622260 RepID=UPI00098AC81F|nr:MULTISPECIES: ABC transporter ATP-binding protein [unclassified Methylocaldum]MBP1148189.1 putative ABC transport system ATP-binding protein [Methylocaldum sp. RMAD-M]MDV3242984.1 ABC transporter ATP-binding protein [Methylocaldum sp.]MVF21764.1 ABC transporter ATP-binding protein [Methylocaldum sp. BRCS4]
MSRIGPPLLVELRQVGKVYHLGESRITALKTVNLSIHRGEFVAVWGPSGSGKSTLCNLIGLLDVCSSGTVRFEGQDVAALSDDQRSELRNRGIGFVFQSFNLIPVLSALENVMLPLQISGVSTAQARRAARKRLAEVGLDDHAAHRPAKLSGGQQQRVAIARALVTDPALVIADEPTANLDSENALRITELMRRLNSNNGTTFVFSTHDQRLLERVERQIQMRDGEIIDDRSPEQPAMRLDRSVGL